MFPDGHFFYLGPEVLSVCAAAPSGDLTISSDRIVGTLSHVQVCYSDADHQPGRFLKSVQLSLTWRERDGEKLEWRVGCGEQSSLQFLQEPTQNQEALS